MRNARCGAAGGRGRTLLGVVAAGALVLAMVATPALGSGPPSGPPGHSDGLRPSDRPFTLVNYNIAHGRGMDGEVDLRRIADVIDDGGADIATLQEVDRHWSERSDFEDQATLVAEHLDMDHVYGANLDVEPTDPADPNRQYGTAILSSYPILEHRNTHLPMADDSEEQRGLLEALIDVDGIPTWVLTTHFQHTSAEARQLQAEAVVDRIHELDGPVVLTGDLNAEHDDPELAAVFDVLVDAWEVAGHGDGFTFRADDPTLRIDYVLATPGIDITAASVPDTLASDHLPVVADLVVSPRSAGQRVAAEAPRRGAAPGPAEGRPPSLRTDQERPVPAYRGGLPLGHPRLEETRTERQLDEGVTHTHIVRGHDGADNVHTIDVARTETEAEARELATALRRDGYRPVVDPVPAPMDAERDVQLWLVRVGAAPDAAELDPLVDRLQVDGYEPVGIAYLPWSGGPTTGPWEVHVVEIDGAVLEEGRVTTTLAGDQVRGVATVPEIAADQDEPLVTSNAGFFNTSTAHGTIGQLAGISMVDGELVSEAVNGRTSLVLPGAGEPVVSALSTALSVTSSTGGERLIDGLNRMPGLIRSCGGVGGDQPTTDPRHDFTCTDDSELIHVTPTFDTTTEPGDGAEVVLDPDGTVVEFRDERGGAIPDEGSVLSATGEAVAWLEEHAPLGAQLSVDHEIHAADTTLPDDVVSIANGGPRLVTDGEIDIPAVAEGFDWPDDPSFYYGWVFARHPRTVAGVTADGDLILVAIDGRGEHSVGASLRENARILQSFGVEQGLNLDGGGSTLLMHEDEVVNIPSDRDPFRPVADALVVSR